MCIRVFGCSSGITRQEAAFTGVCPIRVKYTKAIQQAPRKIYLYKRADMDGLRDHLARYRDSFLSSDHSHMSVNDMWVSFKSEVIAAIERFIPSTMDRQFDQTPHKKTRQTLLPC